MLCNSFQMIKIIPENKINNNSPPPPSPNTHTKRGRKQEEEGCGLLPVISSGAGFTWTSASVQTSPGSQRLGRDMQWGRRKCALALKKTSLFFFSSISAHCRKQKSSWTARQFSLETEVWRNVCFMNTSRFSDYNKIHIKQDILILKGKTWNNKTEVDKPWWWNNRPREILLHVFPWSQSEWSVIS